MTPRERIYASLQFHDTDIIPYQVSLTMNAHKKLLEYTGDPNYMAGIGNHLASISHRLSSPSDEVQPGHFRDEWGVIWNRTVDKDIGNVENRVLPDPTLSSFSLPKASDTVFELYPRFIADNQDRFRVSSIGFSLFERAWSLRGMEELLIDMVENPGFVHDLLDGICEFNLALIDRALSFDIDAIMFGDDWGSQNGLIMGPTLWREFIKPRIARMYKRVRDAGKYVMIHSCGKVQELFPELIECGLQVFNPFQPEVMDVRETKRRYYGRLAFFGGISVQRLLPHGTPDEVRSEVKQLLRDLGKGGGYIASPSHAVPGDVPPENIVAMIDVLRNQ